MAEKQTFEAVLEKHEHIEATAITIPFDVEKAYGKKRLPVRVWINAAEHRASIFRMSGQYMMSVPKVFRETAGIKTGEKITVTIEKDAAKVTLEVPPDLAEALTQNGLTAAFAKMSCTHQKESARAVEEAKRAETRARRIEKAIELISLKK